MDQHAKMKHNIADDFFNKAKNELFKPEEDIVPYGVCQNAYNSVVSYLTGVLINRGMSIPDPIKVEELLMKCRALDDLFNDLHLAPMYEPKKSEDVWMNLDTARDFLAMADKTRQIVNLT